MSWVMAAVASAFFAGITSILAKCGLSETDSDVATALRTLVVLVFAWAMVAVVGSGHTIAQITPQSWLFLALSGLATGGSWISEYALTFALWLTEVNGHVGVKNFSVHVEARMSNGVIAPIEFNPLRFAGICGTEVAYHAYGFHTYDYFLHDIRPNWDELLKGGKGKLYCMGYLPAPEELAAGECGFDYDGFLSHFEGLQAFYRFDPQQTGALGFIFLETEESNETERAFFREADLTRFCVGL